MSGIWDILEIDETTDLSSIKSAYARKVKVTRPDEQPTAFQQLHQAYKMAVNHAKNAHHSAPSAATIEPQQQPGSQSGDLESQEIESLEVSEQPDVEEPELSEEEVQYRQMVESEYNRLVELTHSVIADDEKRNDTSEWQFFVKSEIVLDPQINFQLGLFLLDSIEKHNANVKVSSIRKRNGRRKKYVEPNAKVGDRVIRYLDTVFGWSGQLGMVGHYLGEEQSSKLAQIFAAERKSHHQEALDSVKGGSIQQQKTNVDRFEQYKTVFEAYENVVSLSTYVTIFICAVYLFTVYKAFDGSDISSLANKLVMIVLLIAQWIGLKNRVKAAYYTMWFTSIILLFLFPVGTIFGGLLIVNLYRAHGIHHY